MFIDVLITNNVMESCIYCPNPICQIFVDMKFKVKDVKKIPGSVQKNKKGTKSPFRINVIEMNDGAVRNENYLKNTKKKPYKEKRKEDQSQQEKVMPNINLMVTEDDELDSFGTGEFSDDGSEAGDTERDYETFMEEMAKLDGKKKKILSNRVEGTGDLSELNFSGRKSAKIDTGDLVSALEDGAEDVRNLTKRLTKTGEEKLEVSLDDVAAARVAREAGYTGVVRDISVWDAVVHSRRAADTLTFPLNKADLRLKNLSEDTEKFKV